jgi:Ca2+-transporting ATPase
MLKQNALVHRLHSVETLGCASVICTDKTGTLTMNKMTVKNLCLLSDGESLCEYGFTDGEKGLESDGISGIMAWDNPVLSETLLCAAVCNNAKPHTVRHSDTPVMRNRGVGGMRNRLKFDGDPTETALMELSSACGIDCGNLLLTRIGEKPFDSETKYMSVTCRDREGRRLIFTKGAPDILIQTCTHRYKNGNTVPLGEEERAAVTAKNDEYASRGLRVIALCEAAEGYVIFLGLAALHDPLRPQAAKAVAECRRAGITPIMITGDHKLTACAIAREAGILTPSKKVCTGKELDGMSDEELAERLTDIAVFARVTPAHKLRIVRACKRNGMVCAMTGDGVNDAPAIKEASIGVSMGISGTDVTKQAADMILLDDNFATLVTAVREGRTIYANIRKFVRYLIACNIGEILTMLGGIIMGMPLALVPAQLLLVNLVTDGLPAAALSAEPAEEGIMSKTPRSEDDSFFSGGLMTKIMSRGILIAICTLGCFTVLLRQGLPLGQARTGAMLTLVFSQLIHVFECRSEDKTLFEISPKGGKYVFWAAVSSALCVAACMAFPRLADIFSLESPSAAGIAISLGAAFIVPVISGICGCLHRRTSLNRRTA